MNQKLIFLFFSLLCLRMSYAQEKQLSFTLDEAIEYALENNKTVKNAKLDVEAAKKQKWETTTIGLPQINAKVDYQNWLKQGSAFLPAILLSDQLRQDLGLSINDQFPVVFGTKQTLNATATLSQLLFDGSYLVGLQSAKVFLEISKNAKEKTDLEVRKAVINAYGNVLLTEESLKIIKGNKVVLEKNLNETQKIYENGLTEEENVEQLQITLTQINNTFQNAIRLKDISYKMLNITLGIDLNSKVQLKDSLESLTNQNITLSLLNAHDNIENTIEYKIAKNDKRAKELLLKLEKSKALPQLSAFINGGYSGNNQKFDFLNSKQKWFGSSLVGVNLNIPIFSSLGRSAATQRAKINLEKSQTNLTEIEQQIQLKIESAKSNYQFAIEQYINAKNNLYLAQSIEHKNQLKYSEGIATSFELRQAQTQLYASQQAYLKSMLNIITSKVELELVLNKITQNNKTITDETLNNTTNTEEIRALKKKILLANKKASQKSEFKKTTISKQENDTILIDKKTLDNETKPIKKFTGSVIKKEKTKLIVRSIKGVENGLYLIAGVFSKMKNLTHFIDKLTTNGLNPKYFYNPNRKLYYVYLKKYTVLAAIERAKKTKFNNQYFDNTWILSIQN